MKNIKFLILITLFGCNMNNSIEDFLTNKFDCFTLKDESLGGAIHFEEHKNLILLQDNKLNYLKTADVKFLSEIYPKIEKESFYYPLSVFHSSDIELDIILFCEKDMSNNENRFIIQTVFQNIPIDSFNLTQVFNIKNVEEFDGGVYFSDGFSEYSDGKILFDITVYKKPNNSIDEWGTVHIEKKGKISITTSSDLP